MNEQSSKDNNIIRVLVAGGNKDQLVSINRILTADGYEVKIAGAIQDKDVRQAFKKYIWDIVFVQVNDITPASIKDYTELVMNKSQTPVLALADDVNSRYAMLAVKMGARDTVYPMQEQRFLSVVRRELSDLNERRNHLIANSRYLSQKKAAKKLLSQQATNSKQSLSTNNGPMPFKSYDTQIAKYDLTTNLYSQSYFLTELSQVLLDIGESKKKNAVLYFEFSNISRQRKNLGVNASNLMLTDIATLMRDNIGHMGPIARLSNHVFAVLVAFTDLDHLMHLVSNVRSLIEESIGATMNTLPATASVNVGMCMVNKMSADASQLMAKAERACDIARKINKSGVHIYNPEIDDTEEQTDVKPSKNWDKQIRQALSDGRFKLELQMINKLGTQEGDDYELLFRIKDKRGGDDIMPAEFIVAAEQTGLIVVIDQWVASQAITMLAADVTQGCQGNYFIKISNRTINCDTFIPWLMEELKKNDIPNNRLVFEIDATELVKRPIESQTFIRSLKSLNCRVGLEYFGTQKNHRAILEQYDLDFLKLDRSLTHNVVAIPDRLEPIKSIVTLANAADIQTIAEFIEDAKTLSMICSTGIHYIQGHFVQQPGDSKDVQAG